MFEKYFTEITPAVTDDVLNFFYTEGRGIINIESRDVLQLISKAHDAIILQGLGDTVGAAIHDAQQSCTRDIYNARNVLVSIQAAEGTEVKVTDLDPLTTFINEFGKEVDVIWGFGYSNNSLATISVKILATDLEALPQD